jgi:hypothetical protein
MVLAVIQADAIQGLCSSALPFSSANFRIDKRQLGVGKSVGNWNTNPISRFLMIARWRSDSAETSFPFKK